MKDLLIIVVAGLAITAMSIPESEQSTTNNSCKQEDRS